MRRIKFVFSIALLVMLVSTPVFSADEGNLAGIMAIPFVNETGKKEYDWLSKNIPGAIFDSMGFKFSFRNIRPENSVGALDKTKQFKDGIPVSLIKEPDARYIASAVDADIIIFGKYSYNPVKKNIAISAYIFQRSKGKISGKIYMVAPVTNELLALTDRIADSVIEHINELVNEESLKTIAAKSATDKVTLLKSGEGPGEKKIVITFGVALAAPLSFFNTGLRSVGGGLTGAISNPDKSFFHYGLNLSAIWVKGKSRSKDPYNIIDYVVFVPLAAEAGINFRMLKYVILQPFIGAGVSFDTIRTGNSQVYFQGLSVGKENVTKHYLDPCLIFGLRTPVPLGNFAVTPFVEFYGYPGKKNSNTRVFGTLLLAGVGFGF